MKKLLLILLSTAATFIFTQSIFASDSPCHNTYGDGSSVIHCVFSKGLPKYPQGLWIKSQLISDQFSGAFTFCMYNDGEIQDTTDQAPDGNYNVTYSICTDQAGSDCQPLGQDSYMVTSLASGKIATPVVYSLNIPGSLGHNKKFACNPNDMSSAKMRLSNLMHH